MPGLGPGMALAASGARRMVRIRSCQVPTSWQKEEAEEEEEQESEIKEGEGGEEEEEEKKKKEELHLCYNLETLTWRTNIKIVII